MPQPVGSKRRYGSQQGKLPPLNLYDVKDTGPPRNLLFDIMVEKAAAENAKEFERTRERFRNGAPVG